MTQRDDRGRFVRLVHQGEPDPKQQRPADFVAAESFERPSDHEEPDPVPTRREIARNWVIVLTVVSAVIVIAAIRWLV